VLQDGKLCNRMEYFIYDNLYCRAYDD